MHESFPLIRLTGTPEQRGEIHGTTLQESIAATIDVYGSLFNLSHQQVLDTGRHFRDQILDYFPDCCQEIDAIANSACQKPEWIYLLNAHSELISHTMECSTLTFRDRCLLGQNWNGCAALQDLAVLLHITLPAGQRILALSEPGIIGKLGINSCGLGCCVNTLHSTQGGKGIPLNTILRKILETTTLEQARKLASQLPNGQLGCLTVANDQHQSFAVEYASDQYWFLSQPGRISIHTNHYLGHRLNPESGACRSSYQRLHTLAQLASIFTSQTIPAMFRLLSDRSDPRFPVNRPDQEKESTDRETTGQRICTLASVVMELGQGTLHIRKGANLDAEIIRYPVTDNQ